MKLKTINIDLTENELITIHNALEESIKDYVGKVKLSTLEDIQGDLQDELDLLRQITQYFGYNCSIYPTGGAIRDWKSYDDVDEWLKVLVEESKSSSKLVE